MTDLSLATRNLQFGSLVFLVVLAFGSHRVAGQEKVDSAVEDVASSSDLEFFEKSVRPILVTHCYECHSAGATKISAGLMLDSRARLLKGGDSGPAIVPRKAADSELISSVRYESFEMPPKGKLPEGDIETLVKWVDMGAPWPNEPEPKRGMEKPAFDLDARKHSHWMWQVPVEPTLPTVNDLNWASQSLDRFVLSKLEKAGLTPAGPIDRRGLIRRLSFDLLGLPPTPADVEGFAKNESENAVEELVETLLRSPRFGEHWGRHWLDLVRYAESRGHEFDADTPNAFQYRDYIIRAFNNDVPYDQLVREHIAGDLLTSPRLHAETQANESILGTGFWYMGEWVHSPVDIRKDETDRFDNMVDVMSKTFLGVTVSCARCHDHKFDAISTRDYYALTGFLQGSEYRQVRFETIEKERSVASELESLRESFFLRVRNVLKEHWMHHRSELTASLKAPVRPVAVPTLGSDAKGYKVVVNYSESKPSRLIQDGFSFRQSRHGEIETVSLAGKPVLQLNTLASVKSDSFWNSLVNVRERSINLRSRIESMPRPSRTLLTPAFEVGLGTVACLVRGNGHVVACVDSHRLVEGPLHGETIQEFKFADADFHWVVMNLKRYLGHRIHMELTPADNATIEILGVTDSEAGPGAVTSSPQVDGTKSHAEMIDVAMSQWATYPEAWKNWSVETIRAMNDLLATEGNAELDSLTNEWLKAREALRLKLPQSSSLALAMIDSTGEDDRVLIRGSSGSPGETVPRRFLEAIDGLQPLVTGEMSGRLQLAERINDPMNPLTSRVIVNRIWHHLIGAGIVPTVDDFGVLGQPPSNQELLDHLAVWFNRNGRSIKGLIRYVVLSKTYQMSGQVSQESLLVDPKNLLLQHISPKRLSGESIRDSLLAISGELDFTMYGEPIPIHLTDFMDGRGRPGINGPLDGNRRRSIYIAARRNFLSPFMLTFDTPNPFSTMGKRNVSNVPAQALILMNDPFVVERARRWGERAVRESSSPEARVKWMYESAYARPPRDEETNVAIRYVQAQAKNRNATTEDAAVWSDLAHALINMKEFVFLR